MITLLDANNQPQGPYSLEEVFAFYEKGMITEESWAYVEGLSDWKPLGEVVNYLENNKPVVAAAAVTQAARAVVKSTTAPVNNGLIPIEQPYNPSSKFAHADFGVRLLAGILDYAFVFIFFIGLRIFLYIMHQHDPTESRTNPYADTSILAISIGLGILVKLGLSIFYFARMESGASQATLGKRAMGLQVVDVDGRPIGYFRAASRCLLKLLLVCPTFFINLIMAAFTEKKQALHDIILGTYVVKSR